MKRAIWVIFIGLLFNGCNSSKQLYTGHISLDGTKIISSKAIGHITIYEYVKDSLEPEFIHYKWSSLTPTRKIVSESRYLHDLREFRHNNRDKLAEDSLKMIDNIIASTSKSKIPKEFLLDTTLDLKFYRLYLSNDCFEITYDCYNHKPLTLNEILASNAIYKISFYIPEGVPIRNEASKITHDENIFLYTNENGEIVASSYTYKKNMKVKRISQMDRL